MKVMKMTQRFEFKKGNI